MAGLLNGGEVGGPEDTRAPVVDLACGLDWPRQERLAGVAIDQGEAVGMVLRGALDQGLLGGVEFVADVIDKHLNLANAGLGGDGAEADSKDELRGLDDGPSLLEEAVGETGQSLVC